MNYENRLKISLIGNNEFEFYSKSLRFVAKGYVRIVIGKRGPYIEFERKHFDNRSNLEIPEDQKWRIDSKSVYYIEYRSHVKIDNIKVYFQKRRVDYADYRIGKYYISPFDLLFENGDKIIEGI